MLIYVDEADGYVAPGCSRLSWKKIAVEYKMSQWTSLDEMLAMTEVSCISLHSFLSSKFRQSQLN